MGLEGEIAMSDIASQLLRALDVEAEGDWDRAHQIVQTMEDPRAYWIHAYLHRKEGDLSNAAYWYNRANQPVATGDLSDEWNSLRDHVSGSDS
jgi:hypothetical protein